MTLIPKWAIQLFKRSPQASCGHDEQLAWYRTRVAYLEQQIEYAGESARDLSERVEELTTRNSLLEAHVRECKHAKQLAFELRSPANPRRAARAGRRGPRTAEPRRPPPRRFVDDRVSELPARLIGIFFEGRSHWHVAVNNEKVTVPVHDREFLDAVHAGEKTFRAGDVIIADFHVVLRQSHDGGQWTDYLSIDKVKAVKHPEEQALLIEAPKEVASAAASH